MIGEWVYMLIGAYLLWSAVHRRDRSIIPACEGIGTLVGGGSFFCGTVLFLPETLRAPNLILSGVRGMKHAAASLNLGKTVLNLPGSGEQKLEIPGPYFEGVVLFVIGSMGFSFSVFFQAMGLTSFHTCAEKLSATTAVLHLGGAFFFGVGSMGFIGQVGCGNRMVAIGAWSFILGSALYMTGAFVALIRNAKVFQDAHHHRHLGRKAGVWQGGEH